MVFFKCNSIKKGILTGNRKASKKSKKINELKNLKKRKKRKNLKKIKTSNLQPAICNLKSHQPQIFSNSNQVHVIIRLEVDLEFV